MTLDAQLKLLKWTAYTAWAFAGGLLVYAGYGFWRLYR